MVENNKLVKIYIDYYVYNMFGTSGVSKYCRISSFEDMDFNNLLSVNGTRFTDATVSKS